MNCQIKGSAGLKILEFYCFGFNIWNVEKDSVVRIHINVIDAQIQDYSIHYFFNQSRDFILFFPEHKKTKSRPAPDQPHKHFTQALTYST